MMITLIKPLLSTSKPQNKPLTTQKKNIKMPADSFEHSTPLQPAKKFSFTGRTRQLQQITINSVQDVVTQWKQLKYAPYYEALDDKIFPENKAIRNANFSFLDNVPSKIKPEFIDYFKEFTAFPNFQKVAGKIKAEYIKQIHLAAESISPYIKIVAAGFDPTSSVGVERPFPGSDLDKAFVILQNNSYIHDFDVINRFKGHLWFNTDQRILSLNNEDTFPEVYTTSMIDYTLRQLDAIANKLDLSPEDKIKLLIARNKEEDPLKAGVFNIEISKHLPYKNISKEYAKNFAYFIESVRDGKHLIKDENLFKILSEKMNNSTFCTYSNVAQICAKYTNPLKTKLVKREELTDNFDKMPIKKQYDLVKEIIRSVSKDQNNPEFDKYFKNDFDIGEHYNRLNRILVS